MSTQTTQATCPPPAINLTRINLHPIVETGDLLGLGDLHLAETPKEVAVNKQPVRSNAESSMQSGTAMAIHPSKRSISTAWGVNKQASTNTSYSPPRRVKDSPPFREQETLQDRNRRIQEQVVANEKRLTQQNTPGYVPPHLRPVLPEAVDTVESYLPPHLRKPTGNGRRIPDSSNNAWPHSQSGNEAVPSKPSKVSVMLTPISRVPDKPFVGKVPLIEPAKSMALTMPPHRRVLSPAQQPALRNLVISKNPATAPHPISSRELLRHANSVSDRPDPRRRVAVSNPPPPPPIGGTNIRTAYFPLPPPSPPPTRAPSQSQGKDNSSYNHQDGSPSYAHNDEGPPYNGGHSSYGRSDDGGQFLLLDHQRARKLRSYTRYRSKAGFAPHHPRLPFEFLHTMSGVSGVTYGSTIAGRLDSVSSIGAGSVRGPGKTYGRPSGPTGHMFGNDWGNGYRIPEHEHIGGYNSNAVLDESEDEEVQVDDLVFKAWPQPPTRNTNRRVQKPRSVVLSGLPRYQTLEQISRVCSNTGKIERIKMSKRRGMALVLFVDAYTAERFYETTDSRGITLVLHDDETNRIVRPQIFVEMNPEIFPMEDQICHIIDTVDGSRVLRVVGWDRDGLESMVGYKDEEGVSYDELLMRLASRYFDPQEGPRRVESVVWLQNGYGHLEATFIFAGIHDAMTVRDGMQMEQELEACNIDFGTDP